MKQSTVYLSLMALLFAFGMTISSCETSYSDPEQDVTLESTDPHADGTAEGNSTSFHQSSEKQEVPATLNEDSVTVKEYTDDESSKAHSTTRPNKRDSLRKRNE